MTPSDTAILFDRQHLWHPYASLTQPAPVYHVERAEGVHLYLSDGRVLIDGMSSWWSAIHGYNHPQLNQAITTQLQQMSHVMFGGLTHEPAIELGQTLVEMTPGPLQTVFFADSGSVSVEVAIKMALQYQKARGKQQKTKMLSVRGGYYGDTSGAMALCDPVNGMHHWFDGLLVEHFFAPKPNCRFDEPWDARCLDALRVLLEQHHQQIAGIIIEPIVQGAGGMWFYHPHYLVALRQLCDELDIVLIFDEIATGFGRTGRLFACEWAHVVPDIMLLGKALTGGYMTLAATLTTVSIAQGIHENGHILMHGPTFMANPLACATAQASLNLLQNSPWQQQVQRIEQQLRQELAPAKRAPHVKEVRVLGAIGVVETWRPLEFVRLQQALVEAGVWVRPFGCLIYLMPPFIITEQQLRCLTEAVVQVLENWDTV